MAEKRLLDDKQLEHYIECFKMNGLSNRGKTKLLTELIERHEEMKKNAT